MNKNCYIPDYKRVAFTKFRTSSHNLFIEKGRWSRISRENGFCRCKENKIEDEDHVLLHCAITENLRKKINIRNYEKLNELFDKHNMTNLIDFSYEVMKKFG